MPHINLLPWREALRAEKQRQFAVLAGGATIAAALVVVLVHLKFAESLSDQQERNQILNTYISEVDKQITEIKTLKADKKALLARMKVIQKLQTSRPEIVHLWEEIANATPNGVFITKTTRKGKALNLQGEADSNDSVSIFMRQLDSSSYLASPRLEVIDSSKARIFRLAVTQETPSTEKPSSKPTKTAQKEQKP